VAVDQVETVDMYRADFNVTSAVSFKLVTFPNSGNFAYLLIRGTTNNWDALTDAQLWSAAALLQIHRELLPIGAAWTPILDELINAITTIESASIETVSFYKDTTAFAKWLLKQNTTYAGVGVTGHSLGGGLSIITGAQAGVRFATRTLLAVDCTFCLTYSDCYSLNKIPAVALSGPNAMLSRRSFDPPITTEDLDSKTFVRLNNEDEPLIIICFIC
jgi:lipase ATG15